MYSTIMVQEMSPAYELVAPEKKFVGFLSSPPSPLVQLHLLRQEPWCSGSNWDGKGLVTSRREEE
jgi:hypothetical protein